VDCELPTRLAHNSYIRHPCESGGNSRAPVNDAAQFAFYLDLMRRAREQIENGSFEEFRKRFVSNYKTRDADLAKL